MINKNKKILFVTSHDLLESHLMNHFDYSTQAYPEEAPIIYLKEIKKKKSTFLAEEGLQNRHFLLNTGLGQTDAAISLTACLSHQKFDAIICLGFAGALDKDLKIGDILVVDHLFQHDFKMIKNNKENLLPATKLTNIPLTCEQSQACVSINHSEKIFELLTKENFEVSKGTLISGNEFIANKERSAKIIAKHPQAKAIDMEASAISLTAQKFQTPFSVIKIIADNINCSRTEADEQFHQYQSSISHYALPLVNSLTEFYSQEKQSSAFY